MSKVVMLGIGISSSIIGIGILLYVRRVKEKLRKRILRG